MWVDGWAGNLSPLSMWRLLLLILGLTLAHMPCMPGVPMVCFLRRYCAAHDCSADTLASTLSLDLALDLDASVDLVTFVADVDPGTFSGADGVTMGAIEAASSAQPSGANVSGSAAAAAAFECGEGEAPGVWKRCTSGAECYKAEAECDGGEPDCADGSDEGAAACGTTPVPTVASPPTNTTTTPAASTSPPGGMETTTLIAAAGAALLVAIALGVACWCRKRKGGGQVQGLPIHFANPGFKAPQPAADDDGELYADSAGLGDGAAAPRAGSIANATYAGFGAAAGAEPRAGSIVNATYADFGAAAGKAAAVSNGMHDSEHPGSAQPPKAGAAPGGGGAHTLATCASIAKYAAPGGEGVCGQDNPGADKHAVPAAHSPGASYDLAAPDTNTGGAVLKTRYDYDSMSEEEV